MLVDEDGQKIGQVSTRRPIRAVVLTAAIELARAGQQGRGFAVVADELQNVGSHFKY